jgi:alcohol/geraniol dehydrogenase (NADP+)
MKIQALAAHEAKGELKPFSYQVDQLGENECIIKVTACGICASDLTMMAHGAKFPMVPGHEIAGEVVEVGSAPRTRSSSRAAARSPAAGASWTSSW